MPAGGAGASLIRPGCANRAQTARSMGGNNMEDVGGWRFVVGVLASIVAIGIGLLLVFAVFDRAAMAWGLFGAFAVFVVLLLIFAWFWDRRQVRDYPD